VTKSKKDNPARKIVAAWTLGNADSAVADLGRAKALLEHHRGVLEESIRLGREKAAPDLAALADDVQTHEDLLRLYAEEHPEVFPKDRRSVDLAHGRIGWRKVTSIRLLRKVETVIAAIRGRRKGLQDAIFVRETVNKDILAAAATDEDLVAVGAKRIVEDQFYVETRTEASATAHT